MQRLPRIGTRKAISRLRPLLAGGTGGEPTDGKWWTSLASLASLANSTAAAAPTVEPSEAETKLNQEALRQKALRKEEFCKDALGGFNPLRDLLDNLTTAVSSFVDDFDDGLATHSSTEKEKLLRVSGARYCGSRVKKSCHPIWASGQRSTKVWIPTLRANA